MLLSACMGIALLCFFWGYAKNDRQIDVQNDRENKEKNWRRILFKFPNKWYLGFYIASALAVLTKGPIGIVLPAIIIIAFLIYLGKFKEILEEIGLFWGGLIFLLISLPWYVLVTFKNGSNFINAFFLYHNFQRFTGVVNQHSAPWYFYFLIVLILFAPWSVYLPVAMSKTRFWHISLWRKRPRTNQLSLFALFWFVGIFIFFTITATKLPSYILPLIPPAAILVTLLWTEKVILNSTEQKGLFVSAIFNFGVLVLLAFAFILSSYFIGDDPAIVGLPELIKNSGLDIRAGVIWGITALFTGFLLLQQNQLRWLFLPNLLGFIFFVILVVTPLTFLLDDSRQWPLRELSTMIMQAQKPEEKILMIGFKKPTVTFYSQRIIEYLNNSDRALEYLSNLPTIERTVLIIGRHKDMDKLTFKPENYEIIAQRYPYQLIRIIR
jgi:4-amino-4-deoxy-L-arabinose transferase-like glycosyltransferase